MKTKQIILFFLLQFLCSELLAQGYNNNWTFGSKMGFDFNKGNPTFFSSSLYTNEGTASVSDYAGNLLFYGSGKKLFDRTHTVMPNSIGLLGSNSTTQGIVITQADTGFKAFYVFTIDEYGTNAYLRWSLVDMRLRGGLGDVVLSAKNILLDSFMSEKMIVAGSCSNQWVITHHQDSPVFYAYKVDLLSGITGPVVSRAGAYRGRNSYSFGEMKVSKQFTRLALTSCTKGHGIDLFDFDASTGIVSNYIGLDSSRTDYGIEFSAAGTKLYTAGSHGLIQYDLSAGSPAAIRASMYTVEKGYYNCGIRRGPDDMLYFGLPTPLNYHRLQHPDLPGALCGVEKDILKVPLPPLSATLGMGNYFVPHYLTFSDTGIHVIPKVMCEGLPLSIAAYESASYQWFDGDTAAVKTFTVPGDYWVRKTGVCRVDVDTFKIRLQRMDTVYTLKSDTSVCTGLSVLALVPSDVEWFHWSDGATNPRRYLAPTTYLELLSRKGCSVSVDSFRIKETPIDTTYRKLKDTLLCGTDLLPVALPTSGREWYKWNDGDTARLRFFPAPSAPVIISKSFCHYYFDSVRIRQQVPELHTYSSSRDICSGSSLWLSGRIAADTYLWHDGDTGRTRLFSSGSKVWVSARKGCTFYVDTTSIGEKSYETSLITQNYTVCFEPSISLAPPDTFHRYLWGNGSSSADTTVYAAAKLVVVATDTTDCTIVKFNYHVRFVDFQSALADTFICDNEPVVLDAHIGLDSVIYSWSTGDTTAQINVGRPGTNVVSISAEGCTLLDTVHVGKFDLDFSIGTSRSVCKGETVLLECNIPDAEYLWSTGETGHSVAVSETGTYRLMLRQGSCAVSREVHLNFVPCDACVFIPNAFTPNKDGINDHFKPILNCPPVSYQLRVLNRWGQEMYTSSSPNDAWDGTSNNMPLEGNTYFYMLQVRFEAREEEEHLYKGDITLIR